MTGPEVLDVARDAIMTLVLVSAPLMLVMGTGFAAPRLIAAIAILLSSLLWALYAMRRTQDRLIGVLALCHATGSVFDAPAVQMAEALADQAALTGLLKALLDDLSVRLGPQRHSQVGAS